MNHCATTLFENSSFVVVSQLRNSRHRSVSALRRKLHSGGNFFASTRDPLRWARGWGRPPCGRRESGLRPDLFCQLISCWTKPVHRILCAGFGVFVAKYTGESPLCSAERAVQGDKTMMYSCVLSLEWRFDMGVFHFRRNETGGFCFNGFKWHPFGAR